MVFFASVLGFAVCCHLVGAGRLGKKHAAEPPEVCPGGCDKDLEVEGAKVSIFVGTNQSVYRYGDVLAGEGTRWLRDRNEIQNSSEFNGTLLQEYFRSRSEWGRRETDLELLNKLCATGKWTKAKPKEDLVIHFRNGDNVFKSEEEIISCVSRWRSLHNNGKPMTTRLVTVQHYGHNEENGMFFATDDLIAAGQAATARVIDGITQASGTFPVVQSSEDTDVDFCTMVLAKDVCVSEGGFDSVVYRVRTKVGSPFTQLNFFDTFENDHPFGDVVVGIQNMGFRRQEMKQGHPGTLLHKYFNQKNASITGHDVDFDTLNALCQNSYSANANPGVSLLLHFKYGSDRHDSLQRLLECQKEFLKTVPYEQQKSLSFELLGDWHYGVTPEEEDNFIRHWHYGATTLTANEVARVVEAGNSLRDQMKLKFWGEISLRGPKDEDSDFCRAVLAENVCLSRGRFDTLVYTARLAQGRSVPSNFRTSPKYKWDLFLGNQTLLELLKKANATTTDN